MLLALEEAKSFLHVDFSEDDAYIDELIQTAEDYIADSVDDYSTKIANDRFKRKARLCAYVLIQECYDNRTLVTKDNEKLRYITSSFIMQMQYGTYEVTV